MKIELWPIGNVRPYPNNPRHNDDAVAQVAASLKAFGFRQPIVVDTNGTIIVGHTRLKAAQRLGYTEVPVHVAEGLTPEQIRAYRIADNQTATLAEWNLDLLTMEIGELQSSGFDLSLLGFDQDELARYVEGADREGQCDPDQIPAPPAEAITQPGDIWLLGDHRLLCGDSSKAEDVDRLLDGAKIHLVNTDPPYNVAVEPRSNNAIAAGLSSFPEAKGSKGRKVSTLRAKDRPLANDKMSGETFDKILDAWFANISRVLVPGRAFYIWGGYANCDDYPPVFQAHQMKFAQSIIWVKEHPVMNRKDFMGNHEWCFYGWKEGAAHVYLGPKNATDVWTVKKVSPQAMVHLTEKPTELAARAMRYSSRQDENVLDLFGGSGSTVIAAEQTGRHAFVMELDALYCDVIVQRWEKFSGRKGERLCAARN